MDFGDAFSAIKTATLSKVANDNPKGMRLPAWSEDVIIRVQVPDEHSKMTATVFICRKSIWQSAMERNND